MNRILLVDDDVSYRAALKRVLLQNGFAVDTASDGRAALKKFREAQFDVIILDLWMPEKDGLETLIEIRRASPTAKVIAMSGANSIGFTKPLDTALRFGAAAVLEKPFTSQDLIEAISKVT
jgi:DNA-binding response OmpR family regulator